MINRVNTQILIDATEKKGTFKKKIETLFLTELLKVMLENTSFSEGKTTSTYMTAIIPQIAEMMAEREIGIGNFLTENANFF